VFCCWFVCHRFATKGVEPLNRGVEHDPTSGEARAAPTDARVPSLISAQSRSAVRCAGVSAREIACIAWRYEHLGTSAAATPHLKRGTSHDMIGKILRGLGFGEGRRMRSRLLA
jgi:hypothetical protein